MGRKWGLITRQKRSICVESFLGEAAIKVSLKISARLAQLNECTGMLAGTAQFQFRAQNVSARI